MTGQANQVDDASKGQRTGDAQATGTPIVITQSARDIGRRTNKLISVLGWLNNPVGWISLFISIISITLQWRATQKNIELSQQANVSIGRQDGTVADIFWPHAPNGKAGILVYFQNNGRLPARFTWGTRDDLITLPANPTVENFPDGGPLAEFETNHPFNPMQRYRSTKAPGSIGWSGTVGIAGGASFQGVLWELPRERMAQRLNLNDRPFFLQVELTNIVMVLVAIYVVISTLNMNVILIIGSFYLMMRSAKP